MSPSGIPAAGIAVRTGTSARARVGMTGADGHPAGQLGDGRAVLLAHHGAGRGVVPEEQLAILSGAAAGSVPPGGFGVGAVAGAARRGREKVSTSVQSTASAVLACLNGPGMEASSRSS